MVRPFVVIRTRGSAWDESRSMEEQADWPAHATFMERLHAEGFVALVGPLEGTRDALLVIQAEDYSEIIRRLSTDPWTHNGLLVLKECQPWQIRLGSLEVGAVGPGGSGASQPERKPRAGQAARADSRLNGQRGPAKGRLQAKK